MHFLERSLRNRLERTVKDARDIAETAARAALEQLGVGEAAPFAHLSDAERDLRRKLRIHGRQLGDVRHSKTETQDVHRLAEEVAYEHWHRMLFACFLAENNLLMYPDPDDPVAVTLEECEDLAADEGAKNGWELAARYAARMLPQIFRPDSPVFQLALPPEHQHALERLVADLPQEVFTASDALGWVYQFWQARKKDEVNAAEVKIGARELPAVTQLFTEPYMVAFLLDNSLGAWWAARRLTPDDLQNAQSEDDLRRKAAIPGVRLDYLRFVSSPVDRTWTPAAGPFDTWPEHLRDLKVLDPCCGSGHFLVAAFLMLAPMRMALEGLSARDAVDAVLRDNLHGLELDQRCVELAAFALALTAWRYPGAGGYRPLPELHVACTGLSVGVRKEDWKKLANGNHNLRIALDSLYDEFQNAPILGSLLNPAKSPAARLVAWETLAPAMQKALSGNRTDEEREAGVVAHGLAKAAHMLAGKYHWIITNVPYLARGKQNDTLRDYCEKHHPDAKNDLATVFLDRCLDLCVEETHPSVQGPSMPFPASAPFKVQEPSMPFPASDPSRLLKRTGTVSLVLPQNWLFLTSYRKLRERLLQNHTWHLIARLGPQAFQTPMWDFNVQLITLSRGGSEHGNTGTRGQEDAETRGNGGLFPPRLPAGAFSRHCISGLDVSEPRTAEEKAAGLLTADLKRVEQAKQLENPDVVISLEELSSSSLLGNKAFSQQGITSGDTNRYGRKFWELPVITDEWQFWQSTSKGLVPFSGRENILFYQHGSGALASDPGATLRGIEHFGKPGVLISLMRDIPVTLSTGEISDDNTAILRVKHHKYLLMLWAYAETADFVENIRRINQKINIAPRVPQRIPFDLDRWTKVAEEKYPNGLPRPYSDDPTQWIFHGHPCGSVIWDDAQKWTAQGPLRTDATVLQVAVARLLGYRWPAERDADMELADEQREWVNRCQALLPFADQDGLVCIPPVRGEAGAADRLLNLLAAAYGDAWSNDILAQLLTQADHAGKALEIWLREKFFTQHCKLFHHRPFIWHIWDGLRDGFAALVNYHAFDRKTLETLIYTYLGDWISRQKQDIAGGVDGAGEKLAAAEGLKKRLELILEGEAPCDIFVRWKPVEKQPVGWEPDLNDGVRLNIRPFLSVPDVGKKGAGVLRDKPNIHWNKDRGKDVESAPWYHVFQGDRINDHHLSLDEKKRAREEKSHA